MDFDLLRATARAHTILHEAYGSGATFRDGQLEAILNTLSGKNSLVVQKTGWGKSLVYFMATKILRENGAGPTLIISPLLALMENQIDSAGALGVRAATINSNNHDDWDEIFSHIGSYDALIVSPERLSNAVFMERLAQIRGIRLLVIDEAHCISDWGHDFRPDYQRVSQIIAGLPSDVAILATTATANDRVIEDIREQLGDDLLVSRGNLIRENLSIQVNPAQTREERLAWLATTLAPDGALAQGQGIIYCLTHNDCDSVCTFLAERGISALPYYSGMECDEEGRDPAELNLASFQNDETRVLVATVKLGMGYDKNNVRFVIHFQLPQNLIAYYQQIGRAGRDGNPSCAILLHGEEDEDILEYYRRSAQTDPRLLADIVERAQKPSGVSFGSLLDSLNIGRTKLDQVLKYLLVHEYIYRDAAGRPIVFRANTGKPFDAAAEATKQERISQARVAEHNNLISYLATKSCYMEYVARELDAPDGQQRCNICANCRGEYFVPVPKGLRQLDEARAYLGGRHAIIAPRRQWGDRKRIPGELQMQQGWCLYADYYSEGGQQVKAGKYVQGSFSQELVDASAAYLRECLAPTGTTIDCVVAVPSLRHPDLVPDLARRLASKLGIGYVDALRKTQLGKEQKMLLSSSLQQRNIEDSTVVANQPAIQGRSILLVDDMVDSRWSLTVLAAKLLEAGAARVYPFALVRTGGGN